ncbi:uncharacterized protein LOC126788834 isoform X1 [Argentina anserina]|uniref:uncharacterized protein LOC126788834 isoform X1 n=1 Tax=Argentina anserina TaxID=57926 RepID=UPI0021762CC3|nr:uncharacterized protein LOC126788834 isoform X1 [Potentilla anserina]
MNQPKTKMSNQERMVRGVNDQMEVCVQIRGSPSQIRELFQGRSSTAAIQQGTTAYSISGSTCSAIPQGPTAYLISGSTCSGVQFAEIESGAKHEEICNAKLCCGGCCLIIFSPLVKIAALLSGLLTCCC